MDLSNIPTETNGLLSTINKIRRLAKPDRHDRAPIANVEVILQLLLEAEIELHGLMPWSSNYTFLIGLTHPTDQLNQLAVYKPCAGEEFMEYVDGAKKQAFVSPYLLPFARAIVAEHHAYQFFGRYAVVSFNIGKELAGVEVP